MPPKFLQCRGSGRKCFADDEHGAVVIGGHDVWKEIKHLSGYCILHQLGSKLCNCYVAHLGANFVIDHRLWKHMVILFVVDVIVTSHMYVAPSSKFCIQHMSIFASYLQR